MTPHPRQPLSTLLKPRIVSEFLFLTIDSVKLCCLFMINLKADHFRTILDLQNLRQCRGLVWTRTLAHLIQAVP